MKKDIRAYGYEELQKEMATIGEKAFRAKQIYEWLHVKLVDHFDEMTNLSKALREKLEENYEILPVVMLERQISQIDGTNKFLFRLPKNQDIVGIPDIASAFLNHFMVKLHQINIRQYRCDPGSLVDTTRLLCQRSVFPQRWRLTAATDQFDHIALLDPFPEDLIQFGQHDIVKKAFDVRF